MIPQNIPITVTEKAEEDGQKEEEMVRSNNMDNENYIMDDDDDEEYITEEEEEDNEEEEEKIVRKRGTSFNIEDKGWINLNDFNLPEWLQEDTWQGVCSLLFSCGTVVAAKSAPFRTWDSTTTATLKPYQVDGKFPSKGGTKQPLNMVIFISRLFLQKRQRDMF